MPDDVRTLSGDVDGSLGTKRISLSVIVPKGREKDDSYLHKILENEYDKKYGATAGMPGGLEAQIPGVKVEPPELSRVSTGSSMKGPDLKAPGWLPESVRGFVNGALEYGVNKPVGFLADGFNQASEGLDALALGPKTGPELARGASNVIRGGSKLALPLAAPAMLAHPVNAALGIGAGMLAQHGTEAGLKSAGVQPEYADLAGDVAGYGVGGIVSSPKIRGAGAGATRSLAEAATSQDVYRPVRTGMLVGGSTGELLGLGLGKGHAGWGPGAAVGGVIGAGTVAPAVARSVVAGAREGAAGKPLFGFGDRPQPTEPINAEWATPDWEVRNSPPYVGNDRTALPPGPERVFNMGTPSEGATYYPPQEGNYAGTAPEFSPTYPPLGLPAPAIRGALPAPPVAREMPAATPVIDISSHRGPTSPADIPVIEQPQAPVQTPAQTPLPVQPTQPTLSQTAPAAPGVVGSPPEQTSVADLVRAAMAKAAPQAAPPEPPVVEPPAAPVAQPEVIPEAPVVQPKPEALQPKIEPQAEKPKSAQDIARAALSKSTESKLPDVAKPEGLEEIGEAEGKPDPRTMYAKSRNSVLEFLKRRFNVTVDQVQRELGLSKTDVSDILRDLKRGGLVNNKGPNFNYERMRGEDLPDVAAPTANLPKGLQAAPALTPAPGELPRVAAPNAPESALPEATGKAAPKGENAKLSQVRQSRLDSLREELARAEDEGDDVSVGVLKSHLKGEEDNAKLELSSFKTHKTLLAQIDNTWDQITRLEDLDKPTSDDKRDLSALYREMAKLEQKRDYMLKPDSEKYGDRVANMRSLHADFPHATISAKAKSHFGVKSSADLTPEQLTELQEILTAEKDQK